MQSKFHSVIILLSHIDTICTFCNILILLNVQTCTVELLYKDTPEIRTSPLIIHSPKGVHNREVPLCVCVHPHYLSHEYIGVSEHALGWFPLGLGLVSLNT